jgi:hypothetical protein
MIGYWNDAKSDILRLLDGRNRPGAEAQDAVTSRLLLGLSRQWRTAPPRSALRHTPAVG